MAARFATGDERYVFISYARDDQAYVDRLVAYLTEWDVPGWIDRDTNYGSSWPKVIKERIDGVRCLRRRYESDVG